MASDSARACFVHVQKTGGLTVDQMLRESGLGFKHLAGQGFGRHLMLRDGLRLYPQVADYWIFGFVRNPWARLWSWWSMVMRRVDTAAAGNQFVAKRLANNVFWQTVGGYESFEEFIERGMTDFARLRTPQLDYLTSGDRLADFIGRTERLGDDMAMIYRRFNIDPLAPPRNNSGGASGTYRDHYTPAMRRRVADAFAPDIEEFGYAF